MRAGLLYIVFLTLAFLLVASKQTDNNHSRHDLSAGRSVTAVDYKACTVPEINFSLKKIFTEPVCFKLLYNRFSEETIGSRTDLTSSFIRQYQAKRVSFKPLIKKPFQSIMHYSAEKADDYLLS